MIDYKRPLCGARTRAGGSCRAKVVEGKRRCRMHGGLSTGPKTPEGIQRIVESNRRRKGEKRRQTGARPHDARSRVKGEGSDSAG